jgi:hypothetical protein
VSEVSEWELREREERDGERRRRDEEMGTEVEEHLEVNPESLRFLLRPR